LIVVVAFGKILPKEILESVKHGCINIHASLLPVLRGAAPIQWSILNGDTVTGVTAQQMDVGIDTGDILMVEEYKLDAKETGGSLFERLESIGADLLVRTLDGLEDGVITPIPQQGESTYAAKLDKTTGIIDFNKTAVEIERLVRGLNPWPSAYTKLNGKTLKIWDVDIDKRDCSQFAPGTIYDVDKQYIYVSTGEGGLVVRQLQLEGKKRMDTESFLRGYSIEKGMIL
jgi:methionyl-tRNA formyltransferase